MPVVHDHSPEFVLAEHADPVFVHGPLDEGPVESWIDEPTGADPVKVSEVLRVIPSLLMLLSDDAARLGVVTPGMTYRTITRPAAPFPPGAENAFVPPDALLQ